MIDRTVAPASGLLEYPGLPSVQESATNSAITLFSLEAGQQPVIKLDLVLQSGVWYEDKPAASWFAA
ncbi:MAG: hypothetical protein OCD76_11940, partial [Reichenbachiella sp.]